MQISEVKSGQGDINVQGTIKSKSEPRSFEKYGKTLKVASATIADDSGEVVLSLWNADIDKVKVGDKVSITKGYASEFQGKIQLSAGKFGAIEVLNASASSKDSSDKKDSKKTQSKKSEDIEDIEF